MATTPITPPSAEPVSTRWLWLVRIAALASIVVIGMRGIPLLARHIGEGRPVSLVLVVPALVPYALVLLWLGRKPQRKGLALAVVTGWGGLFGGLLGGIALIGDGFGVLLVPQHLLLLLGAYIAHAAITRQTSDRRPLTEGHGWAGVGLAVFGVVSLLSCAPNLVRTRQTANQASAVSSLRTINTAEATYAGTYKTGYSPSLAELGTPPGNAQPSASAAGLIDSLLANGIKSGYSFTYSPGPKDTKGHISAYTVVARPLRYMKTGVESFFTDESGVIRTTNEDRPATAKDTPVGG